MTTPSLWFLLGITRILEFVIFYYSRSYYWRRLERKYLDHIGTAEDRVFDNLIFYFMRTGEVFAVQAELLTLRSSAIPEGPVVSTLRMGIFLLI